MNPCNLFIIFWLHPLTAILLLAPSLTDIVQLCGHPELLKVWKWPSVILLVDPWIVYNIMRKIQPLRRSGEGKVANTIYLTGLSFVKNFVNLKLVLSLPFLWDQPRNNRTNTLLPRKALSAGVSSRIGLEDRLPVSLILAVPVVQMAWLYLAKGWMTRKECLWERGDKQLHSPTLPRLAGNQWPNPYLPASNYNFQFW